MPDQAQTPAAAPATSAPAADVSQAAGTQGTALATDSQPQTTDTSLTATAAVVAPESTKVEGEAAATPVPKAPEQYADFTLPEGVTPDPVIREQFKQLAKELDLTQEQAQKLIDLDAQRVTAQAEAAKTQSTTWFGQIQADKELGGEKLQENAAVAAGALDKFGTTELKTLLQETGLILHPEIVRMFYRAGKAISEDSFVGGSPGSSAAQPSTAQRMYPNMNP